MRTSSSASFLIDDDDASAVSNHTDNQNPGGQDSGARREDGGIATESVGDDGVQLFSATLVQDHDDTDDDEGATNDIEQQYLGEVVEAKPALEGFPAIVANKRFKYLIATVTPLVLLLLDAANRRTKSLSTERTIVVRGLSNKPIIVVKLLLRRLAKYANGGIVNSLTLMS